MDGVWLKTPRFWLAMLDMLNLLFSERLGGVGGWNRSLAENPQGLAGDAGDLELVLLGYGEACAGLPDQVQRFLITHRLPVDSSVLSIIQGLSNAPLTCSLMPVMGAQILSVRVKFTSGFMLGALEENVHNQINN